MSRPAGASWPAKWTNSNCPSTTYRHSPGIKQAALPSHEWQPQTRAEKQLLPLHTHNRAGDCTHPGLPLAKHHPALGCRDESVARARLAGRRGRRELVRAGQHGEAERAGEVRGRGCRRGAVHELVSAWPKQAERAAHLHDLALEQGLLCLEGDCAAPGVAGEDAHDAGRWGLASVDFETAPSATDAVRHDSPRAP